MRWLLKTLGRVFYILMGLLLGYLITASILSLIPLNPEEVECEEREMAFVTSNGLHLFLILPIEKVEPALRRQIPVEQGARYLAFGWGDREFYRTTPRWSDLRPGVAFRALFLKTDAAMHVIGYSEQGPDWESLALCPAQFDALNAFLRQSFQKGENGKILPVEASGYSENDYFFEARGHYTCFRTSNTWVSEALKVAWIRSPIWTPFDWGVLWHV